MFGSALRHFGVLELLRTLHAYAPPPRDQKAEKKGEPITVHASDNTVSGFVFKIQANMDPNHRDRVAFLRLCSGEFKRGMRLKTAGGKQLNIHNPMMFLAQDREIAETAYAGDVIGVPNHGQLRVGDSLSENGDIKFAGIPNFAPELLRRARVKDPMKAKHLRKALESLAEEGVTQLFKPTIGSDMIVGAVGQLQFEVMIERVAAEYNLEVVFEPAPYNVARWLSCDDPKVLEAFLEKNKSASGTDLDDAPVYLARMRGMLATPRKRTRTSASPPRKSGRSKAIYLLSGPPSSSGFGSGRNFAASVGETPDVASGFGRALPPPCFSSQRASAPSNVAT